MLRILFFVSLAAFFAGCENTAKERNSFSAYFDVDSLLDAQIDLLSGNVNLRKVAELNGRIDSTFYDVDTLLAQELNAFRKANINKPAYEGLYTRTDSVFDNKRVVIYKPTEENSDLEVKKLKLIYEKYGLGRMEAIVEEDHWLYNSVRELNLEFKDLENTRNYISKYHIKGAQKMILRDRTSFEVTAEVIPRERL